MRTRKSAGLPVLASTVGELPYSIRDGVNGYTVAPDDAGALADGLRTMLVHPEKLSVMGQAARADILDRFSWDHFAETGTAILNDIRQGSA